MSEHKIEHKKLSVDDDFNLKEIVDHAVDKVAADSKQDLSLRARLGLLLAAIIVIANSTISIYNSIALRREVTCNHKLNQAVAIIGDQNRNITRTVLDQLLTGQKLTASQYQQLKKDYDAQFDQNTTKRKSLLMTTCTDGSDPTVNPTTQS